MNKSSCNIYTRQYRTSLLHNNSFCNVMSNNTGRPPPLPPRTSTSSRGALNAAAAAVAPPRLPPRQVSQAAVVVDGEVIVDGPAQEHAPTILDTPAVAVVPAEPAAVDVPGELESAIPLEPTDPSTATSISATKPTTTSTSSSISESLPNSNSVTRKNEAGNNWMSPQTWINAVANLSKEETEDIKVLREQVEQEEIKRYMNNFTKVSSRMGRWTLVSHRSFFSLFPPPTFTRFVSLGHLILHATLRSTSISFG
jgi:hypothetical protein